MASSTVTSTTTAAPAGRSVNTNDVNTANTSSTSAAAGTSERGANGERLIQQDFIARIRFTNALPPPPTPPKLLDMPDASLASGQYTNPGFAWRLARDQPVNIEIDAELGMPLDLVGMPGIFDGDESCTYQGAIVAPFD